jgi:thiol-disulfide isomerase/thioredoxin
MVQNFFTDELAFWANEYEIDRLQQDAAIIASSKLNAPARDIELVDLDGNNISLLDTEAELIVLYFYSPECENCQKETPKLKEVYNQWKNRGIEVFAVCIEPDEAAWRNYIVPEYTDWINGFDPNNGAAYNFKYHVNVTPEIYVIDQERKIVGKDLKAFQLPTIFERHL